MIDRIILFPYYLILKARNHRYTKKNAKVAKAEVPTICIGNITVGGTGKTPQVEMVLRILLESDEWGGKNIAVLSRGYKRRSRGFQQVPFEGSAFRFGDEPSQIKKKFPSVTVAVDKDRVEGCDLLCHPEKLQGGERSDIIVLDDAFQYRKLKADKNIVLVDYNQPLAKDRLLPFGRLRDLPERIFQADMVVVTKCPSELSDEEKTAFIKSMGFKDYDPQTCQASCKEGVRKAFFTRIEYEPFKPVFDNSDPRYIYSKRLVLFTGIAKDHHLLSYLCDSYSVVERLSFPDHHKFSSADFRKIENAVRRNPTAAIATTEKDAQRVLDHNGLPLLLRERMFKVPIHPVFLTGTEEDIFKKELLTL